jgi:hypothetical protein
VFINGERIEYLIKEENVLKQLRRGSKGTAIAEIHTAGTEVIDLGPQSTIPYQDTQEIEKFNSTQNATIIYDGSTRTYIVSNLLFVGNGDKNDVFVRLNGELLSKDAYSMTLEGQDVILTFDNSIDLVTDDTILISSVFVGPLNFTPIKSQRPSWYTDTIPDEYGACDQIELFVAGQRLRKDPTSVYTEELGSFSPVADTIVEADFSVDGFNQYVRLTNPPLENVQISIIRKVGKSWYDRGEFTTSSGVTLLDNNSAIAKFIAEKTTKLPE